MQFLWIFPVAIALAAAEKQAPELPPGCGEASPTTTAPKPDREYGIFTDGNRCHFKVLKSKKRLQLASCVAACPKRNVTAPFGTKCLQLIPKNDLQERKDTEDRICYVGKCIGRECYFGRLTQRCSVPDDTHNYSE
uniref:Evasin n=1 Tax=Amblyomma parvum TaxID=251391 RepID=A0A023FYL6_AMBPA